jgi:hypothetical protein
VIRYELGDDAFLAELLQQAAHRRRLGQQLTT